MLASRVVPWLGVVSMLWLPAAARAQTTFNVTTNSDSGAGSLRQALLDVPGSGTSIINFDAGLGTITLLSELFVINKPGASVTINGNGNTPQGTTGSAGCSSTGGR